MKVRLNKKKIITIGIVFLIILILFLVFSKNFRGKSAKIMMLNFESRVTNLEDLDEINTKKFGWLQVQGTTIDVPILKTSNVDGDYSYGWVSSNSIGFKTRNVLIGHNVLNVSNTPMVNDPILTDFEDLMAFVYYDFAKENMYLSFTRNGVDKTYVIYAIGFYDYDYDSAEGLNSSEDIEEYIKRTKENSIYKYDVIVNENDDLLTIKTCTRYFGNQEKQQFVIDARALKEGETPLKYSVKKTKLYGEYHLIDSYQKDSEL